MATPQEYAELYSELRAAILTRFFAFGRYFRANHLALIGDLGYLRSPGASGQSTADDTGLVCWAMKIDRPEVYSKAADLVAWGPPILPRH